MAPPDSPSADDAKAKAETRESGVEWGVEARAEAAAGAAGAEARESAGAAVGEICLILGPMGSGKSEELIRRVNTEVQKQRRCLVAKHTSDVRYGADPMIHTHEGGLGGRTSMPCVTVADLADISESDIRACHVVGIDEGQMFTGCAAFCARMSRLGKRVIVACLDFTFEDKLWPETRALFEVFHRIEHRTAVCGVCNEANATRTYRVSAEVEVKVVGSADKYMAVCSTCRALPRSVLLAAHAKKAAYLCDLRSATVAMLSRASSATAPVPAPVPAASPSSSASPAPTASPSVASRLSAEPASP